MKTKLTKLLVLMAITQATSAVACIGGGIYRYHQVELNYYGTVIRSEQSMDYNNTETGGAVGLETARISLNSNDAVLLDADPMINGSSHKIRVKLIESLTTQAFGEKSYSKYNVKITESGISANGSTESVVEKIITVKSAMNGAKGGCGEVKEEIVTK